MAETQRQRNIFSAIFLIVSVLLLWRYEVARRKVIDQEGKYMLGKVVAETRKKWIVEVKNALVNERYGISKIDRKKFDDGKVFYIPIRWAKMKIVGGVYRSFPDQACRNLRPEMIDSVWDEPIDFCLDTLTPEGE